MEGEKKGNGRTSDMASSLLQNQCSFIFFYVLRFGIVSVSCKGMLWSNIFRPLCHLFWRLEESIFGSREVSLWVLLQYKWWDKDMNSGAIEEGSLAVKLPWLCDWMQDIKEVVSVYMYFLFPRNQINAYFLD